MTPLEETKDWIRRRWRLWPGLFLGAPFLLAFILPLYALVLPRFIKKKTAGTYAIWLAIWGIVAWLLLTGRAVWLAWVWLLALLLAWLYLIVDEIIIWKQAKPCTRCRRRMSQKELKTCPNCKQDVCSACSAYERHIAGIGSHDDFLGCANCFDTVEISYF